MGNSNYMRAYFDMIGYKPTRKQWDIHLSDARLKLVSGGERGGKSIVGSKEAGLWIPRSKLVWIVGDEYEVPRTEFEYILEDLITAKLVNKRTISFPKLGQCSFDLHGSIESPGCHVVTKAAADWKKLGQSAPDFILVCEAARLDFFSYLRLRGRLAEKKARMVMTGTFEQVDESRWYEDFYSSWSAENIDQGRSFSLPTWSNDVIYPLGEEDPEIIRIKATTPFDIFQERYAGIPCKPSGLIMSEFSNAIHVQEWCEFNPDLSVDITIDPGYAGAHVVLAIQQMGDAIGVIDEIYYQGYTTEEIIEICQQRKWWGNVTRATIDFAGRQHQAMEAPIEVWRNKTKLVPRSQMVNEKQGIDSMRALLLCTPPMYRPRIVFNQGCLGIIAEMGGGKSPVHGGGAWLRDINTGRPADKNDHACKALIYWIVCTYGYALNRRESQEQPASMLRRRITRR